jgi:hypothetical protein
MWPNINSVANNVCCNKKYGWNDITTRQTHHLLLISPL